jgi:hypothetical protein
MGWLIVVGSKYPVPPKRYDNSKGALKRGIQVIRLDHSALEFHISLRTRAGGTAETHIVTADDEMCVRFVGILAQFTCAGVYIATQDRRAELARIR